MFGLRLFAPAEDSVLRQRLTDAADAMMLPALCFTDVPGTGRFDPRDEALFLRQCTRTVLTPGDAIPGSGLLPLLRGDRPAPANALRRALSLQLSLLPLLRMNAAVTPLPGSHLLADCLLTAHPDRDGFIDLRLPEGNWVSLADGSIRSGMLRSVCPLSVPPVWVRGGTLLPIAVNDRQIDADDADRLTLHWFLPEEESEASFTLADGTVYRAGWHGGQFTWASDSKKPWHLIVHTADDELLLK